MKMRKAILISAALAVALMGHAQSPRGKAEATIDGTKISVDYGRPGLKGRDMMGEAPVGTVWRMGADQATTFRTDADLDFAGLVIPKGAFSLFAKRVDEKNWVLLFNEQTGQWGNQHDPAMDLGEVPLVWENQSSITEQFTIEIASTDDGGELKMLWGNHLLKTSFSLFKIR